MKGDPPPFLRFYVGLPLLPLKSRLADFLVRQLKPPQQSITPRECIRVLVHHITHPPKPLQPSTTPFEACMFIPTIPDNDSNHASILWPLFRNSPPSILLLESPCPFVRPEQNFSRIIHTCSIVKYQGSQMYASYINASTHMHNDQGAYVYASCIHA